MGSCLLDNISLALFRNAYAFRELRSAERSDVPPALEEGRVPAAPGAHHGRPSERGLTGVSPHSYIEENCA